MQAETEGMLNWADPVRELIGFVAVFLAAGAVGFRLAVVRGRLARGGAATTERVVHETAARRAAWMGAVGTLLSAALLAYQLPELAARRHVGVAQFVTGTFLNAAQVVLLAAALIGFLMAAARVPFGWVLATLGVIVGQLRGALAGQWSRLVNPVHELAAGLWIGTLFVLVVAGMSAVLGDQRARDRRGPLVAEMVNGFSPMALACGGVVVAFGLITAWRHLKTLPALWTTSYGYALIAKLCVVAVVFGLGAWNWRRQRPTLGSEPAAIAIRRSATVELLVAAVVLVITAVLVSLPAPKGPGG